jgi:hypothetical protein
LPQCPKWRPTPAIPPRLLQEGAPHDGDPGRALPVQERRREESWHARTRGSTGWRSRRFRSGGRSAEGCHSDVHVRPVTLDVRRRSRSTLRIRRKFPQRLSKCTTSRSVPIRRPTGSARAIGLQVPGGYAMKFIMNTDNRRWVRRPLGQRHDPELDHPAFARCGGPSGLITNFPQGKEGFYGGSESAPRCSASDASVWTKDCCFRAFCRVVRANRGGAESLGPICRHTMQLHNALCNVQSADWTLQSVIY